MQVFQPGDEVLLGLPLAVKGTGSSFQRFLLERVDRSKRKLFDYCRFVLLSPVPAVYAGMFDPSSEDPEFVPPGYLEFQSRADDVLLRVVEDGLGGFRGTGEQSMVDHVPVPVGEVLHVWLGPKSILVRRMRRSS